LQSPRTQSHSVERTYIFFLSEAVMIGDCKTSSLTESGVPCTIVALSPITLRQHISLLLIQSEYAVNALILYILNLLLELQVPASMKFFMATWSSTTALTGVTFSFFDTTNIYVFMTDHFRISCVSIQSYVHKSYNTTSNPDEDFKICCPTIFCILFAFLYKTFLKCRNSSSKQLCSASFPRRNVMIPTKAKIMKRRMTTPAIAHLILTQPVPWETTTRTMSHLVIH